MPRNKSEKLLEHHFQTDVLTLLMYATKIKEGRLVGLVGHSLGRLTPEQLADDDAIVDSQAAVCGNDTDFLDDMGEAFPFNEARNAVADFIIMHYKNMVFALMYYAHVTTTGDGYHRLSDSLTSMSVPRRNIFMAWPASTKTSFGRRLLTYARTVSGDLTDALFPVPLV